jgi:NAD(P)-dependent dehydrogenase (short-subunit alcohol dehydrogenase family)
MGAQDFSLDDRVAVVTGAGKGLGRAWALHLASLGARVVVNNRISGGRQASRSADAVVAAIRLAGGEAVANYDSVEESGAGAGLVELALQHYGQLDVVVANAGIDRACSFHNQRMAEFDEIMQVNFFAIARLLHAAWPHMRKQGYGRILVSGSSAGCYGNHGQAAYSSSKAALQGLVKTLSIEGASRNILVNALAPYAVTQLTASAFPAEQVAQFSPEAVSRLVGWLVSEKCRLTGKTFLAGAEHARLVATLESDTFSLGGDISTAVSQLVDAPCRFSPASAIAEFEDFRASF